MLKKTGECRPLDLDLAEEGSLLKKDDVCRFGVETHYFKVPTYQVVGSLSFPETQVLLISVYLYAMFYDVKLRIVSQSID